MCAKSDSRPHGNVIVNEARQWEYLPLEETILNESFRFL